ncbi:hypothetical protein PUNSTDRAFT_137579 [Punctularia strigosozonata HHB-11173 SS5]|uniref:uncharacterized protein n=1 Tax=Punctularia strigosozonata (strain HHB-11173) TaxID=741275 RepID=UPI0004417B9E|nr:uncharacterized protein PUNSTDRAFT_137579 [Punctularia strigosozonata HHB-11173 SS5]EIN05467.1 hypothetical protein PUNSTDRAFT_137579 [Punctularia strigosozonata HHB-11173 SS5]
MNRNPFSPVRRLQPLLNFLKPKTAPHHAVPATPPHARGHKRSRTEGLPARACRTPPHRVALQHLDTSRDAIVITALAAFPFCCHEDLVTMARAQLVDVALALNASLPGPMQIDVNPARGEGAIRRAIEVVVGLREKEALPERARERGAGKGGVRGPPIAARSVKHGHGRTQSLDVEALARIESQGLKIRPPRTPQSAESPPDRKRKRTRVGGAQTGLAIYTAASGPGDSARLHILAEAEEDADMDDGGEGTGIWDLGEVRPVKRQRSEGERQWERVREGETTPTPAPRQARPRKDALRSGAHRRTMSQPIFVASVAGDAKLSLEALKTGADRTFVGSAMGSRIRPKSRMGLTSTPKMGHARSSSVHVKKKSVPATYGLHAREPATWRAQRSPWRMGSSSPGQQADEAAPYPSDDSDIFERGRELALLAAEAQRLLAGLEEMRMSTAMDQGGARSRSDSDASMS